MPRRVQDIVPGSHRSIRDIPIERGAPHMTGDKTSHKSSHRAAGHVEAAPRLTREKESGINIRRVPITPPPTMMEQPTRKKSSGWIFVVLLIVVLAVGAAYVFSAYFSRATFTIEPKTVPLTINGTYIAQGTPDTELSYQLVTLSRSASTTVAATDSSNISTKAQGTVTLYNNYSTQSQRLIAGTRLVDDANHIYRLKSSVVIPGKTTAGPGKLTTTVVADQSGSAYNIPKTATPEQFTIVAYKGTDKYETMYGRLATDITGGFVGTKKVVPQALLASTTAMLKDILTKTLLEVAEDSLPAGHIMYDSVYVSSFSEPTVSGEESSKAVVTMQATLTGIFFEKDQLVERLAKVTEDQAFGNFSFKTLGLENLDMAIANVKDFSPQKKNSLILRIKGDMNLVGIVPVEEIKAKLAGIRLSDTQQVFEPYEAVIKSGSGELVPPWSKVPTDLDRITITVEEPSEDVDL